MDEDASTTLRDEMLFKTGDRSSDGVHSHRKKWNRFNRCYPKMLRSWLYAKIRQRRKRKPSKILIKLEMLVEKKRRTRCKVPKVEIGLFGTGNSTGMRRWFA
jgi:hypothetical protein